MKNEYINRIEQAVTNLLSLIKGGVRGQEVTPSNQSDWDRDMRALARNNGRLASLLSQVSSLIHMDPDELRERLNRVRNPRPDSQAMHHFQSLIEPIPGLCADFDGDTHGVRIGQLYQEELITESPGQPRVTVGEIDVIQCYPREITQLNSGAVTFGSVDYVDVLRSLDWSKQTARRHTPKPYRRVNKKSWVSLELRYPKDRFRNNRSSNIVNLMGKWDEKNRSRCRLAFRHFFKMVSRDIRALGADPKYLNSEVFSLLETRWRASLLSGMGNMGNAHRLKTTKNSYHDDIRMIAQEIKKAQRKSGSAIIDNYIGLNGHFQRPGPMVLVIVNLHDSECEYISLKKVSRAEYQGALTHQGIVSLIGNQSGRKRRAHRRKVLNFTDKTIRGLAHPISKFREDEVKRIAKSFQLSPGGTQRLISVAPDPQIAKSASWTNYTGIDIQKGDLALDKSGQPKVLRTIAKKEGLKYPDWYRHAATQDLLRYLENKFNLNYNPSEKLPEISRVSFIWCQNLVTEEKIRPMGYFNNNDMVRRWVNDMHYSARGVTLWRKYRVGRPIFAREICIMDVVNDLTEGDVCGDDGHDWDHEDLSRAYLSSPKAVLQRYHKRSHTLKKEDYRGSDWEFEASKSGCPDEIWAELKKIHCSEIQLLTTLGELARESDIMGHCVWGFSKDIAKRKILIFHIGGIDGSTLGFNWVTGNIVHHNGVRDRKPTQKEKEIEALLIGALKSIRDTWSLNDERRSEE